MKPSDKKSNPKGISFISIGYTMTGGMVFFSLGGYFLDKYFLTKPIYTLIGLFLGLFYCGYEIWKLIRK